MERTVTTHLELDVAAPAKLVLAIAVAQGTPLSEESLVVTAAGEPRTPAELVDVPGNRLHVLDASAGPVVRLPGGEVVRH